MGAKPPRSPVRSWNVTCVCCLQTGVRVCKMPLQVDLEIEGNDKAELQEGARTIALKVHPEWNKDRLQFQV